VRAVLDKVPQQATTIVTCMDVRIDPLAALGLVPGDAHVVRNAGAVVTDDVVRSLIVSQRLLGTRRIVVMGHTDCGISGRPAVELSAELGRDLLTFTSVEDAVRASIDRLRAEPDVASDDVHGYIFDVTTGEVRPVPVRR
jgi:carbonic anhydrase